ncbi:homologous recombination OB-fold protein isoform X2 [Castor canadensis]|uniref:Homologous recombination OB-fold protein isoform X2 n=1 Tax=Castor canadensis TaxID=51338 RepID=A0AC58K9R1_CASCN
MACSLRKLFAVEEEFEDEDFLSAVEDAENQFVGALPVNAGRLRPVSSKLQETVQAQSLHSPAPSEVLSLPALGTCLPNLSGSRAIRDPSSIGTAHLRPVSTSSSWTGNQRRMMVTEVLQKPAGLPSSAPHHVLTFERHQWGIGGFEGPEQDEFDEVLANMELEGTGMEQELGVNSEATHIPPAQQQQEDPVLAKKARVADLSKSCLKGPRPATCTTDVMSVQGERLEPIGCRTPRPYLRPVAAGNLPVPTTSAVPTQQPHWEVYIKGPPVPAHQLLQAAGGSSQSSPQNRLPRQPFQSPNAWLSGKSHFPGPRTPNSNCSTPSRTSSAVSPQGPLQSRASMSSVESPIGTTKGLHSSPVPQAALQTPIVTNHLVQLVTAASRTPKQPTRLFTRAKTRRFPGPAGLLPHQHSGKNLEEIMVSMPQTPTHGALAKFRTEIIASSQRSVEEDFGQGPWLTMKSTLGLDERDPTCFLCTYSIVMVLRKAALKQLPRNKVPNMAVMIKSLTRSTVDASVVFKDPTGKESWKCLKFGSQDEEKSSAPFSDGIIEAISWPGLKPVAVTLDPETDHYVVFAGEMQGTVHRVLLETRQNELKPGSVLLLKQIGVFSPSLRNHYLNVTPNNLVHIYSPDSRDGNFFKPSQPFPKDPGSFHGSLQPDMAVKPTEDLRTAQIPEAGVSPEEELSEADDLDGLLSELPEDFFCGPSSLDCPKAGHPP